MFFRALFFLVMISAARAEFLHMEVTMKDMDCASCSDTLGRLFEKMRGVKNIFVDMKNGSVSFDLETGNRITIEQVWDAIKRVGFTPGTTVVTVRGSLKQRRFTISVLDKTVDLVGLDTEGENLEIRGLIDPPPDPRTPWRISVGR